MVLNPTKSGGLSINAHLFTNRSRQIAFGLLMFIGAMMVANPSQAGGGGGIGLEIHIKDGLETQAVYVGLAILIAVRKLLYRQMSDGLIMLMKCEGRLLQT